MTVYILHRHYDTPDVEGNDILGAYVDLSNAQDDMRKDADATMSHYPTDFWNDDMSWETDMEIHLGLDPMNGKPATIYCWNIKEMSVQGKRRS